MKTSKITYQGNLRTEATHIKSGNKIITDAPTDNEGKGEAFSPTDLVATALGSCMLTIIGIKAQDNGMNTEGISVDITKIMRSNPRKIDEIIIEFNFGYKNYTEKEKSIIKNAAKTCPVALSIDSSIKQSLVFNL
ncbi:MAG: OsmC family protein [Vicingaceae bacterium]|nr:OsmC family protein [Vicingaceae bacterium]